MRGFMEGQERRGRAGAAVMGSSLKHMINGPQLNQTLALDEHLLTGLRAHH